MATLAHDGIEVEDTGAASIVFENGALGTIACTTSMWPGHFRTITLAGSEGTESRIYGRLTAWQNWIFQRPNAVGDQGALTMYGQPERPHYDFRRT